MSKWSGLADHLAGMIVDGKSDDYIYNAILDSMMIIKSDKTTFKKDSVKEVRVIIHDSGEYPARVTVENGPNTITYHIFTPDEVEVMIE